LDGVPLFYFRVPFHRYHYPPNVDETMVRRHNQRHRIPFVLMSRLIDFMTLTRRSHCDVLYVNRAYIEIFYPSLLVYLLRRVPLVCDWDDLEGIHGFSTSFRKSLRIQMMETIHEVVLPRIAKVTVVASRYLAEFAENLGVPADRVFYSPTVADTDLFTPEADGAGIRKQYGFEGRKVLIYCGNLMAANGVNVSVIMHTLHRLLQRDPDFRLIVVGDGDLVHLNGKKGALVALAEQLGIAEKVKFTGGVPYREVPSYISAADLCLALFPVNLITMTKSPLKVYEYMATGKPVVARSVGEMSYCIRDGETGILVYSDDPAEYADKIHACFAQDGLLRRMGDRARQSVEEHFSWHTSAEAAYAACCRALGHKGSLS
jgi:glycosyltransferase involved in cell wall biosynthesis